MTSKSNLSESNWRWLIDCPVTLLFMAGGIFVTFYPTLTSAFARLQTDPGDSRLNNFILEHHWRWLNGFPLHTNLWDSPFFYPTKNVLAYTDTLLSLAPVYWLWRSIGISPEISFTLWMITLCIINYLIALILLRKVTRVSWMAANFGAYLISFGSSRIAQLGHQQLLSHAYTLLAMYALFAIFSHDSASLANSKKRSWIVVFFLCFSAQFYAGYYYGYFLFLVVLIASIWAVSLARFRGNFLETMKANRLTWLVGALSAALILAPLAYHYILVARDLGGWGPGSDRNGLAHLSSYFWLGGANLLYGWTQNLSLFATLPIPHEHQIGLGIVTTAILFWFMWRYREQSWVLMIILVTVTILIAFTMFPGRIRLWRIWYYSLPGIQGIRIMARIGILLLIPAGIALAMFVDRQRSHPKRFLIVLLIGLVCCLEQLRFSHSYDRDLYRRRIELIEQQITNDCQAFFVSEICTDQQKPAWPLQLDCMWASALKGVPTIIGYSGKFPDNYAIHNPLIRAPSDIKRIGESLDEWCIQNSIDRQRVCWIKLELPTH